MGTPKKAYLMLGNPQILPRGALSHRLRLPWCGHGTEGVETYLGSESCLLASLGFPEIRGTFFGVLASILGSPYLWKLLFGGLGS